MMRVNIYYGGRGLIEDPVIYITNKLTEVLKELNIEVKKYNLYEDKRGISVLPKTLKEADAIILAASVEWWGIGGMLQQFLDSCWLYGDKEKMHSMYMMPIVASTTAGEKDAFFNLIKAWEILGGIPTDGICTYVSDYADFETNPDYAWLIEKRAEDFYRCFSKKRKSFPSSTGAVCENVMQPKSMHLTPQESEQLSMYVSDVKYVEKQKEDIHELSNMFKGLLGETEDSSANVLSTGDDPYVAALLQKFHPVTKQHIRYILQLEDAKKMIMLNIRDNKLDCSYTDDTSCDVLIKLTTSAMKQVLNGSLTMHNAFLEGKITAKGNFNLLKTFDALFPFA